MKICLKTCSPIIFIVVAIFGCSPVRSQEREQLRNENTDKIKVLATNAKLSDNFKNTFSQAKKFWQYYKQAKELHMEGKYQDSINIMEKGYEVCPGSGECSLALSQMGYSYEKLGDYERATNFFQEASRLSYNPTYADEFSKKASQMRDLFKTRGYQDMKNPPDLKPNTKTDTP